MKYKRSMIMLVLVIFIFGAASVCASDVNDTVIASEDSQPIELSQSNENEVVEQANDEEIISEGTGTFLELQQNITQGYDSGYITLDKDYEYEDGFTTEGISITQSITIDGQGHKIDAKGKARIFNIQTDMVMLQNITFINGQTGDGGAIKWEANFGSVLNCRFENNTATGDGGAIYWHNRGESKIGLNYNIVRGCSFVNNTANYVNYGGGALHFNGEKYTATVEDCNFTGNSAPNGGAVFFFEGYDTATVTNCNFVNNTASVDGGAVYFDEDATGEIKNCNFVNNTASGDGGAIDFDGTGTVTNCNFTDNHANYGGAVYFYDNGVGRIRNCNFTDNHANYGGAVYILDEEGTVTNCNFTNNAAKCGGAVYFDSGNVTDCNFINNKATGDNGYGGAIMLGDTGTVKNCNFINNKVTGDNSYGGAIRMYSGSVENCNFTNSTASSNGSAVYFELKGTVTNCNFTDNHADYSGAVYFQFGSTGNVSNCNFTNNTATQEGGAVYFDERATGRIENSNFNDNSATYGGAVYFYTTATVKNCNFTGNNATTGSAIYFFHKTASKTVSNSRFLNNRANSEALEVTKNDNNITITFTGNDNLLNAIYSNGDVIFTNVAYWGANGIANTGSSSTTPSRSNGEAGQNITVIGVVNGNVINRTKVTDENGEIVLEGPGEYNIVVRHDVDSYYTKAEINFTAEVIPIKSESVLSGDNLVMAYKDGSVWAVTLSNAEGNPIEGAVIRFAIKGVVYSRVTGSDGVACLPINLISGTYAINATFEGDDDYEASFVNATVTVNPAVAILSGDNLNMSYKDGSGWAVSLTDANGNAISGVNIAVGINGATYRVKTGGDGVASLPINLQPGNYTISASFSNSQYEAELITASITVNRLVPVLSAEDLTMEYLDGSSWNVALADANGVAVVNSSVKFTVSGKTYTVKTDGDGVAGLPIKLAVGTYDVSAKFEGSKYLNPVEVTGTVVVNLPDWSIAAEDVNMTYRDGTDYNVQITDVEGNPVARAGIVVKVTINGKSYNCKTNADGIASLPINLAAGTYDITAEYNGKVINNTITVNNA